MIGILEGLAALEVRAKGPQVIGMVSRLSIFKLLSEKTSNLRVFWHVSVVGRFLYFTGSAT